MSDDGEHVCPEGYDPAIQHDCRDDHSSKIHFMYQYADCPGCARTADYLTAENLARLAAQVKAGGDEVDAGHGRPLEEVLDELGLQGEP